VVEVRGRTRGNSSSRTTVLPATRSFDPDKPLFDKLLLLDIKKIS
jgi:hypothetical protein